jgi:cell division protein FtsB
MIEDGELSVWVLRATIEQQAAMLREITMERDALKLRVAELEELVKRGQDEVKP